MKYVTFAVPCYNSAQYMEKCINSLLVGGEDVEIVIVDDGSTKDDTAKIADEFQKKYPSVIKAVHQENGGHGEAVNTGLKNATGIYYVVVDSDDWVDKDSLIRLLDSIKSFETEDKMPDAYIVNYVYEHVYDNKQKVVRYTKEFPQEKMFSFSQSKKMTLGKFFAMHSLIYKRQILSDCGINLPKHTFYVDNIVAYQPLPFVKTFYYMDIDFYRYFIGREDQSVNEQIIMKRIDQHIKVTEYLIDCCDLSQVKNKDKKLFKYMQSFITIMMTINSIYLIKLGDKESMDKKAKLWELLEKKDKETFIHCKKTIFGLTASKSKFVCGICKGIYVLARKVFKFN